MTNRVNTVKQFRERYILKNHIVEVEGHRGGVGGFLWPSGLFFFRLARIPVIFLWAEILLANFFLKSLHHISRNMGMCRYFFKMLAELKMAARGRLQNCLWAQKHKVRNYLNFTITFHTIWRCAGDLFRFLLKFKRPPWINFIIVCGRKNLKIENNSHFTIILHTVWECAGNFIGNGHHKSTFKYL